MSTLAEKVAFVRKHWRTATGGPFEIDPDDPKDWLYHHFWKPLQSFRLVAIDYGGKQNRARFRKVAAYVREHAPEAEIKKKAEQLVKSLTD